MPLAQSSVTFVDERTVRIDMTSAMARGFDLGAIYELVYVAKKPYEGGAGLLLGLCRRWRSAQDAIKVAGGKVRSRNRGISAPDPERK